MFRQQLALIFAAFATASALTADNKEIDNPYYASWDKLKAGGEVVYTDTLPSGAGAPLVQTAKYKVKEVKPDSFMIEYKVYDSKGKEGSLGGGYPVRKTISLPEKASKDDAFRPDSKAEFVANEKLTIGGKTYETRKFRLLSKAGGFEFQETWWVSPEVPGMIVKKESQNRGGKTWITDTVRVLKEVTRP